MVVDNKSRQSFPKMPFVEKVTYLHMVSIWIYFCYCDRQSPYYKEKLHSEEALIMIKFTFFEDVKKSTFMPTIAWAAFTFLNISRWLFAEGFFLRGGNKILPNAKTLRGTPLPNGIPACNCFPTKRNGYHSALCPSLLIESSSRSGFEVTKPSALYKLRKCSKKGASELQFMWISSLIHYEHKTL